jgi:VanZ family protein
MPERATALDHRTHKRDAWYWASAWWPVLLSIAIVTTTSSVYFGAPYTSHPLRFLFQAFFGPVSDAEWETIHFVIRKSGHFIGYGFIGLAWLRAWWMTLRRSLCITNATLALLGCALTASCDEWHQSYLPDRTGSPWDVLLDCCGALTMLLLVYLFMRLFRPKWLVRRN